MRLVVRNSFARHSILAERVQPGGRTCAFCGTVRYGKPKALGHGATATRIWLYRFHVDDDQGSRQSGPIAGGKLFCSRGCCEAYTDQPFDETARR